ncbi:MAG: hypothetical protein M3Q06_09630, partial [Bacteroidota bacterium]|nr:hypothetical protein [Bacteroidota bacterium]
NMNKGQAPDLKRIEAQLKDWEWQWVQGRELYPATPTGDPVAKAKSLHRKYFPQITNGKAI